MSLAAAAAVAVQIEPALIERIVAVGRGFDRLQAGHSAAPVDLSKHHLGVSSDSLGPARADRDSNATTLPSVRPSSEAANLADRSCGASLADSSSQLDPRTARPLRVQTLATDSAAPHAQAGAPARQMHHHAAEHFAPAGDGPRDFAAALGCSPLWPTGGHL